MKINTPEVEPKLEGCIQVGEKAYITKYATTKGIIEAVVTYALEGYADPSGWVVQVKANRDLYYQDLYYQGKDLFKTRKEALVASVKLVERELVSIDKSREKMRSLKSTMMDELVASEIS